MSLMPDVSLESVRSGATPLILGLLVLGLLWLAIVQREATAIAGVVTLTVGGVNHWLGVRSALKQPGKDT